jgi:ribosomal protein S18 acetylase RimI-like enzyme
MTSETQSPINWSLELNPPREKIKALRHQLRQYNREKGQTDQGTTLGIFLRDEQDNLAGGISAYIWGTTVEINFLWLSESLRGQGIGQHLMLQIEQAARERGAIQAVLSTFSFQAPDFYKKLGYEKIATIDGLGDGHKKIYLHKTL